jgi:hypothetical protein
MLVAVHHHGLMGTRSRIGIELKDHSVVSVYCHWDGYPEGNGRILNKHYTNRDDVKELIDGGSMSSLRTRKHSESGKMLRDESGEYIRDAEGNLMLENDRDPQPDYHEEWGDRSGMESPWMMHSTFDEFCRDNADEEFCYLFSLSSEWKCWELTQRKSSAGVWYTSPERTEIPA